MSASIPVSVPAFTTLQDDVDYVLAAHHTTRDDEITALATMVGMLGKAQSWGVDFVSAMKNAKAPICTKVDADTISVSAGVVWIANGAQSFRLPRRNTSPVTVEASNLDTGSMAVGYYYIFAVADSAATTFTVKISASPTAPTGLTNFELIGWFYNETSSVLDIAKGLVGNVKGNNRDVPNKASLKSAVQVTATTSASDDTEALLKFYSSGRPCLIIYNGQCGISSANALHLLLSIDGADDTATERWVAPGATDTNKYGIMTSLMTTLSAGTHTIQGRFYVDSGTGYMNAREIMVIEL